MKTFQIIKTFGAENGFSCAFRQWRAKSDCKYIHGYSLGFKLVLETSELDENSWVYDFGGFKQVRRWIESHFDHTLIIANDDPEKEKLINLQEGKIAKIIEFDDVGCEKFADYTFNFVDRYISSETKNRVKLVSVEVFEHGANSARIKNI